MTQTQKCLTMTNNSQKMSNIILIILIKMKGLNVFDQEIDDLIQNCPGRKCNIDTFDETAIVTHSCGQCNIICQYCGALHWRDEENTARQYTKCCRLGKALVNRLPPPPALLRSIMERSTVPLRLTKTFFKNARWFNTSASFASCKRILIERFIILFFFRKLRSS